jgi:hypothetical protein
MGRGRAKAKQTKVARDLKYRTFNTDFSSLERELRSGEQGYPPQGYSGSVDTDDDDDGEDYPYTSRLG